MHNLGRTWAKLKNEKRLNIGYIGGSVTEGAGASNPNKTSYRALVTNWFKTRFPESAIIEINAAIGGTGSDLGAFRCQKDLLSGHPNLVFIEFAVNDNPEREEYVIRSMEGLVRQIWKNDADTDIVFVYTTAIPDIENYYDKGTIPPRVVFHQKLADYYGIPSVNPGMVLWQKVRNGEGTWQNYFIDIVHPSDVGHNVYADEIIRYLGDHKNDEVQPSAPLPVPMVENPLENAFLEDAWLLDAPGWAREDESLARRYPHRIASNVPGTELHYRFKGTAIGVYWMIAPDSGDIEWSIDDGEAQRVSSWDKYALHFSRANYRVFADNLPAVEHILHIKILSDKQAEATGTWIRIGALMVNGLEQD